MSWSMKSHGQSKPTKKGVEKNGPSRSSTNYALTDPFVGIPSFSFFSSLEERRSTSNSSSHSSRRFPRFRKRPGRDGSFVRLGAGVEESVTCIPWQRSLGNPSRRVDASRAAKGGEDTDFCLAQSWWTAFFSKGEKKVRFSFLKFSRAHPGR